jgi:hypothetical protein
MIERSSMAFPESNMSVHRIRLRGPWQLQSALSSEAPPRTVRLPARWSELLEEGPRQLRLCRRFHRPTNLAPDDQVAVTIAELPIGAQVQLNGTPLGMSAEPDAESSVFPTPHLQATNLLTIEFDLSTTRHADGESWGDVSLVISSP